MMSCSSVLSPNSTGNRANDLQLGKWSMRLGSEHPVSRSSGSFSKGSFVNIVSFHQAAALQTERSKNICKEVAIFEVLDELGWDVEPVVGDRRSSADCKMNRRVVADVLTEALARVHENIRLDLHVD